MTTVAEITKKIDKPKLGYPLLTCVVTQCFLTWGLFFFPPIAVAVAPEFDLDPIAVGYQFSIVFGVHVAFSLYSGEVVARLGPVRSLQLGIVFCAIGQCLYFVPFLSFIVVGSIFVGVSHCFVNSCTALILRQCDIDERSGFVFSVKQASTPIGFVLSSTVGPLLATFYNWRLAIIPVLICLAISFYMLMRLQEAFGKRNIDDKKTKGLVGIPLSALQKTVANKPLLYCAIASLWLGMCQTAVMQFTSNMFAVDLGHTIIIGGYMVAAATVCAFFARIGWGYMADRLKASGFVFKTICVIIILCCVFLAFLPKNTPLTLWYVLFALIGSTAISWNGLSMSELTRHCRGRSVEKQLAGAFFIMFLSPAFGPTIFIGVHKLLGEYAISIAVLTGISAALAIIFIHLSDRAELLRKQK